MRLNIENFGIGTFSTFIYGDGTTSIVNNPVLLDVDVLDQFNIAVSGTSPIKSQQLNYWPLSAFALSSTALPGMTFANTSESVMSTLMYNSFGVGITEAISATPYRMDVYNHTTSSHVENAAQDDNHYIAVYKPLSSIVDIDDYVPFAVIGPIHYNYIVEFTLQNSEYRSNFRNGTTFINAFHTKNMYNQVFNTETLLSTDYDTAISGASLDNCRTYTYLGANSKDVYLVYSFGRKYLGSAVVNTDSNYLTARDIITEYTISSTSYSAPDSASQYEFVERIKGVGGWEGGLEGKHKTNIFSVKILNSRLNESITDTAERAKIQNSINIVLRRLLGEFIPAHTELFNIYWEGR